MSTQEELHKRSQKVFAAGVSAGGRYNHALKGPLFLREAAGPWLESVGGRRYLDFHNASGAAFFGYRHPRLQEALELAIDHGFFINFDTEYHAELAELLCTSVPCAEKVRLSNTGTEATLAAIRLARHFTGKEKILKFEGHFHGMHELIWYNHSGIGQRTPDGEIEPVQDTAGMPKDLDRLIVTTEFNDGDAFLRAIKRYKDELAAVIMEPISFNCGCMPARKEFIELVRKTCDREGIVLMFDEVLSGFRMSLGGAQEYYGVVPDLCTLAKALGGGFPISAIVGRRDIMDCLNPSGPVAMSGTYTGSLIPVLASVECLKMMRESGFYGNLNRKADLFYSGVSDLFKKYDIVGHIRGVGARFGLFFGVENPEDDYQFRTIADHFDAGVHSEFVRLALEQGLYFLDTNYALAPTHYGFTAVHSDEDLETALQGLDVVFKKLGR